MRFPRLRRPLMLAIVLLLGAGRGAGAGEERPDGTTPPLREQATGGCTTIAAIVGAYPAMELWLSPGPAAEAPGRSRRSECGVTARCPSIAISGEIDPAEAVRRQFESTGWTLDAGSAAYAPAAASFAFRKKGILCAVLGGVRSRSGNGTVPTAEVYEFEAFCVSEPGGSPPDR